MPVAQACAEEPDAVEIRHIVPIKGNGPLFRYLKDTGTDSLDSPRFEQAQTAVVLHLLRYVQLLSSPTRFVNFRTAAGKRSRTHKWQLGVASTHQ